MKKSSISSGRKPAVVRDISGAPRRVYASAAGLVLFSHAVIYLLWLILQKNLPNLTFLGNEVSLRAYVSGGLLAQGLLVLVPTILIMILLRLPAAEIAGGRPRAGSLIIGVMIGIPAAVVFQGLNNLLIYALVKGGVSLPEPSSPVTFLSGDLLAYSWPLLLLIAIVGMVLPGICEELMFRGVMQTAMHSTGAVISAVFWQAVAFALFHADPLFWLPPFLAGLMLGFIRLKSESIFPAILAHISLNLSLLAINPLLPRLTRQLIARSSSQATSLLYASLIAACVAAVALVPLIVIIGQQRLQGKKTRKKLRPFPFDWFFVAACLLLLTVIIWNFRS